MGAVGYRDTGLDEEPTLLACVPCTAGYDRTGLREISREEAAEYGDQCQSCGRDLTSPRPFVLQRHSDATGVSGVGVVAEGVEFSDGVVALRWLVPAGAPGSGNPTSVVFHDNGLESVRKIHGHGGQTEVVFT